RAASAVEPTRSQNITDSWRRSGSGSRPWPTGNAGDACGPISVRGAPQSPQNRLPSGLGLPQLGQDVLAIILPAIAPAIAYVLISFSVRFVPQRSKPHIKKSYDGLV